MDSGAEDGTEIADYFAARNIRVVSLLLSHVHFDHIGGARELRRRFGTTIYVPYGEKESVPVFPGEMENFRGKQYLCPDFQIPEGTRYLNIKGAEFEVISCPGHSDGHTAFVTPDEVCYLGDLVSSPNYLSVARMLYIKNHSIDRESKRKMRERIFTFCIAAHKKVFLGEELGAVIDKNLEYLNSLREEIRTVMKYENDQLEESEICRRIGEVLTSSCGNAVEKEHVKECEDMDVPVPADSMEKHVLKCSIEAFLEDIRKRDFRKCAVRFTDFQKELSCERWEKLYADYQTARKTCMAEPMDYLKYHFYEIPKPEWENYVTRREYEMLCSQCNDPAEEALMMDKARFSEIFRAYLGRTVIVAESKYFPEFEALCRREGEVFLKPRVGGYGKGISRQATGDKRKLWEKACKNHALIEECIRQAEPMSRIYPGSVNTVRAVTVRKSDGTVEILAAAFRCGRYGEIKDNGNGIFAAIDVENGRICGMGTTHFGGCFYCHPDTGTTLYRREMPHWNEFCDTLKKIANVRPGLVLMNWDLALREDGKWILIEGNVGGGFGLCQEALGRGLRKKLPSNPNSYIK